MIKKEINESKSISEKRGENVKKNTRRGYNNTKEKEAKTTTSASNTTINKRVNKTNTRIAKNTSSASSTKRATKTNRTGNTIRSTTRNTTRKTQLENKRTKINNNVKEDVKKELAKIDVHRSLIKVEEQPKSLIKHIPQNRRRPYNKKQEESFRFKKSPLKIIPLGGLLEVGKNITVFEYEDEIIIVDCGLAFPEDDMLGVDLVIPDITYLERNKGKIKGMVITHGHEDHIGAIPYFLKQINVPIYATRLTIGLISNKLEEHGLARSTKLNIVKQGETVKFGKMQVEFIRSCHSIPDSVALAINTPVGTVVHTGDFKIDYTPIDDERMDFGRLAELGNKGVLALMSDSTNSERKGYTMSESSVGEVFDKLFLHCTKRIVVATFASNVHRVQQIVNSCIKYGRKIAVCGRSMINMINTARELGYIKAPENIFIDIDMIRNYTDEQLVIITTGSQGETMSALTRMAAGEHRKVEITPNDLIIISATPIPGNEKLVSKVIDDLMKIGAEVVYSALEDIHVSGHACQEEQKLILSLVKPKYFIPVHGEYRHLIAHSETAKKLGISQENVFIMSNGRVLELTQDETRMVNTVPTGRILVDGLGIGDVGNIVLRDRQHLSQDGLIIVVLTMNSATGEVIAGPDVISRGFVYVRESENLMDEVKKVIRDEVRKCEEKQIKEWAVIKSTLKDTLREFIYIKTKRNPMLLPIIMEV